MRKSLFVLLLLQAAAFAVGAAEKRIYAHYMGCFPAWGGSMLFHYYDCCNHLWETNDYVQAMGGRFHIWPLVPHPEERPAVDELVNAKMEISRAKRYGFDGFAFDAWAGGEEAKQRFVTFCKAVEEMKVDFGLTVCFDPSCLPVPQGKTMLDTFVETAQFVLANTKGRAAATFEGKPLFFGYYSNGIDPATNQGSLEERFAAEKKAWDAFRSRLGRPVFIHGSLDSYNGDWTQIGTLAAKVYDAAGGFLGGGEGSVGGKTTADALQAAGKVWSQPLTFQYSNPYGWVVSWSGIDLLRLNWEAAIKNKSRLIQFVTWNDYGEASSIAPTTGHNYSILRANKYYIDLWKGDGVEPPVEKDEVHVFFRKSPYVTDSFPFYSRCQEVGMSTHVITYLKDDAEVTVKGRPPYQAKKGMHLENLWPPLTGEVRVTVRRKGRKVLELTAPEVASNGRWREDPTISAFGTGFDEEWKRDFPGTAPEYYSENGDVDKDGLPNWFEMVYFGKFPQMRTAKSANPKDDPDHDGFTNLEEYRNGTDPRFPDKPYKKGYVWNSATVPARPVIWNPCRDDFNHGVWYTFNDRGPDQQKATYDGNWKLCPLILNVPLTHNYVDPTWQGSVNFNAQTGQIHLNGNAATAQLYGWKAPIKGDFEFDIDFAANAGGGGTMHARIIQTTAKGTNTVSDISLQQGEKRRFGPKKMSLKRGDMVILAPDYRESQGISGLTVNSFKVKFLK